MNHVALWRTLDRVDRRQSTTSDGIGVQFHGRDGARTFAATRAGGVSRLAEQPAALPTPTRPGIMAQEPEEDLARLLDAARRDGSAQAVQALADAVRVQARSESGRAAAGALPGLLDLMVSVLGDVDLARAWPSTAGAMANLAANNDQNRDALADAGALARLAFACEASPGPDFDRCAAAALGNIVADNGACQQVAVDSGCAVAISKLVVAEDASVRQLAMKACENLGPDPHIVCALVEAGVIQACCRVVLEHPEAAGNALAALLRVLAVLPAEASLARMAPRGAVGALTVGLRCESAIVQAGSLAVLQQIVPPGTPLSDDDIAAFGAEPVDGLLQLICSTAGAELTARLGSCAVLRSLVLTPAGNSLLWERSAVAPLTAAVVHTTAAIDTETTVGQELLDQARLRLDCLTILNALANSEERCLSMVKTAPSSASMTSSAGLAGVARELRATRLSGATNPEPEPEPEHAICVDLAGACVAVSRHKHDLEGTRVAINVLRNLALPAPSAQHLLGAGVLSAFGNAVHHKDPNVGACAAAGLRIMASHSSAASLAMCTTQWCVHQGCSRNAGGDDCSLVDHLLQIDLEKIHRTHCALRVAASAVYVHLSCMVAVSRLCCCKQRLAFNCK